MREPHSTKKKAAETHGQPKAEEADKHQSIFKVGEAHRAPQPLAHSSRRKYNSSSS
jgi:hypothetical protein